MRKLPLNDLCKPHDALLLDFWFSENIEQADVDRTLASCDIEVLGATKALILAYAMQKHSDLDFGAYAAPRLKGVLNFYRFANLRFLAHLAPLAGFLETIGIPFLPGPDLALKMLRPEMPRPLSGLEIFTSKKFLDKCHKVLHDGPYEFHVRKSAIDVIHRNEVIGRIRCVMPCLESSLGEFEKLCGGARQIRLGAREYPCPAKSDLLRFLLAETSRRIECCTEQHALIFSVTDAAWLMAQLRADDQEKDKRFMDNAFIAAWAFYRQVAPHVF